MPLKHPPPFHHPCPALPRVHVRLGVAVVEDRSLVAAGLACGVPMARLKAFYYDLLHDSHSRVLGPMGRMSR